MSRWPCQAEDCGSIAPAERNLAASPSHFYTTYHREYSVLRTATGYTRLEIAYLRVERLDEFDHLLTARPLALPPPRVGVLAQVAPLAQRMQLLEDGVGEAARVLPEVDAFVKVVGSLASGYGAGKGKVRVAP